MQLKLTVNSNKPVRLDQYLRRSQGFSRRLLTRLKQTDNGITRNGEPIRSIDIVQPNDIVILTAEDTGSLEPNPLLSVPIAFENEDVVVFDKPSGMPVHPSVKHQGDTLGNFFAAVYPNITFRPVNRLDRDTSGLCIIAKNAHAANRLQGRCEKVYFAAVHGLIGDEGTINAPIARERDSIILRCVREDGQPSVTHYRRIAQNEHYSLAEVHLETGRTHQIRVHFSHIGHPLAGDDLYGGCRDVIPRQALHCGVMRFDGIEVRSPLPQDILGLFGVR